MSRLVLASTALASALAAAPAAAAVLVGDVVATRAAWSADDRAIVTTATVRTAAGDVTVEQLGGTADGYTMVVFDDAPPLAVGMRAEIAARPAGPGRWFADGVVDRTQAGRAPFVRTTAARSGQPLAWAKGCVQLGYAVEGTAAVPGDQERAVIEAVIAHWNQRIGACAYQHLVSLGPIDREVSGRDFVSVIKFRDTTWCRPAVDGKPMKCHSHAAAGVTTAVYVNEPGDPRDGELVDADIELNGVDFAIAVDGQSSGPAGCQADLANTLTHEVGHVLGLEHTCLTPADAPHLDGAGQPVPLCTSTLTPAQIDATMFPFQECGETSKASLSDDEVAALCAIYPTADDPGVCAAPDPLDDGCCSTGARPWPSPAIAVAALALRRRRRRRATNSQG